MLAVLSNNIIINVGRGSPLAVNEGNVSKTPATTRDYDMPMVFGRVVDGNLPFMSLDSMDVNLQTIGIKVIWKAR